MQVKTWLFAPVAAVTLLHGCSNQSAMSSAIGSREIGSREDVVRLDRSAPLLVSEKQPTGPMQQWGKDARFMELLPELQELSAR
jgi:hypothetical protein